MIQRLDCMKSLLHLFYKHGTASAKSLRNNGLRTLSQANVTPHIYIQHSTLSKEMGRWR